MKKTANGLLAVIFLITLMLVLGANTFAQEKYPTKPIQVVIPYGPGGTHDIAARIVDSQLQEILSVPIVHLNKPGGGGVIGGSFAKEQKPDGYTILYGGITVLVELPLTIPNCSYNTEDFVPIARVTYGALILSVRKDSPLKTLEKFIEAAKKDPGKISMGVPGLGTTMHLAGKRLEMGANIELNTIPFKGDGDSITALLGGHVDCVMTGITSITPHLKSGEVIGIASTALDPPKTFTEIPLFSDKGFPEVSVWGWTGPFVRVGTPEPIIKILSDAYGQAATHPSVVTLLQKSGTTPGYLSSDEVRKLMKGDYRKTYDAAKAAGLLQKK